MCTNIYDLSIHLRKLLSDRGGKINPIRTLTKEEYDIAAGEIFKIFYGKKKYPFKKGYLLYEPGKTSLLKLVGQIDLPATPTRSNIIRLRTHGRGDL